MSRRKKLNLPKRLEDDLAVDFVSAMVDLYCQAREFKNDKVDPKISRYISFPSPNRSVCYIKFLKHHEWCLDINLELDDNYRYYRSTAEIILTYNHFFVVDFLYHSCAFKQTNQLIMNNTFDFPNQKHMVNISTIGDQIVTFIKDIATHHKLTDGYQDFLTGFEFIKSSLEKNVSIPHP